MKDEEWAGIAGLIGTQLLRKALTKGAILPPAPKPAVNFIRADGTTQAIDTRVKITIPASYYMSDTIDGQSSEGPSLFRGIIFPYTPSIQYEHKANYASQSPAHSNFTQYFYQNSSVTPITISGKFTVENDIDATFLLMTLHLLKTLTKMKQGNDQNAGSPPPVCRLSGYGNFMLDNVPVVITSFSHELPENIDYFTAFKDGAATNIDMFSNNSVPVVSTIKVTCNPIYSRSQITDFSVDKWLNGDYNSRFQGKGYL